MIRSLISKLYCPFSLNTGYQKQLKMCKNSSIIRWLEMFPTFNLNGRTKGTVYLHLKGLKSTVHLEWMWFNEMHVFWIDKEFDMCNWCNVHYIDTRVTSPYSNVRYRHSKWWNRCKNSRTKKKQLSTHRWEIRTKTDEKKNKNYTPLNASFFLLCSIISSKCEKVHHLIAKYMYVQCAMCIYIL